MIWDGGLLYAGRFDAYTAISVIWDGGLLYAGRFDAYTTPGFIPAMADKEYDEYFG